MSEGHFDFPTAPPPPDPAVVTQWTQWFGQLRGILILLGGMGLGGTWLAKATSLSDAELSGYVTALVTVLSLGAWLGPTIWSWIEKKQTAWAVAKALRLAAVAAAVASANASAAAGRAVALTVTVTPEGQDNEAVRVSPAEQAAAPSVPVNVTPSPAPRAT